MRIATIIKPRFRNGQVIVRDGNSVEVYPVMWLSKVKVTQIADGLLLTWDDGSIGWKKRNIIVDMVE